MAQRAYYLILGATRLIAMLRRFLLLISIIAGFALASQAQIISARDSEEMTDSVKRSYNGPFFGLYKDNYFTVGTAIGQKPTKMNSDVKFQISLAIRLTNSTLPWGTYLYLFYTQKTFWNVFQNSMPMRDMNFNPGIGLTKPFFSRDL